MRDIALKSDARLMEMHFGAWEMQTWESIGQHAMDAWLSDFCSGRPGAHAPAESVLQLLKRVAAALIDAPHDPKPVAWLTHAGVIRAVQALNQGTCIKTATDWPAAHIEFGSTTPIDVDIQRVQSCLTATQAFAASVPAWRA